MQLSFSIGNQPERVSREEIFTTWQIGDLVFLNAFF